MLEVGLVVVYEGGLVTELETELTELVDKRLVAGSCDVLVDDEIVGIVLIMLPRPPPDELAVVAASLAAGDELMVCDGEEVGAVLGNVLLRLSSAANAAGEPGVFGGGKGLLGFGAVAGRLAGCVCGINPIRWPPSIICCGRAVAAVAVRSLTTNKMTKLIASNLITLFIFK